jgi:hypothetical protein
MCGGGRYLRLALAVWCFSIPCCAQGTDDTPPDQSESEKLLLDRLMAAESGGRQFAKNPRSSALGPFQFVEGTFLDIVRRKLPALTVGKSDAEISRLRVDPKVSRDAALIYIRESAKFFAARNVPITAATLRLAFFVGQTGALKVLAAKSDKPLSSLLNASALAANPRLGTLTAGQLIERSSQEADGTLAAIDQLGTTAGRLIEMPSQVAGDVIPIAANPQPKVSAEGRFIEKSSQDAENIGRTVRFSEPPAAPEIVVHCNLKLPSCRKWLALSETRSQIGQARLSEVSNQ